MCIRDRYMVPGLWGAPLKAVSAFAPPMNTQDFNLYTNEVHAQFDDYDAGMEYEMCIRDRYSNIRQ